MRRRSFAVIGLVGLALWAGDSHADVLSNESGTGNVDAATCSFQGKRLAGKVKIVESFPDVRIKVVASFPDLKVKKVESFADDCGEWQFVESFPDFTVQYVDSFADVEISMVPSFPGIP